MVTSSLPYKSPIAPLSPMRQLSIHPSIHPAYQPIRTSSARIHHIRPSCSITPRFQALAKLPFSEGPNLGDSDVATTMYEMPCEYTLRCFRWVLLSDDMCLYVKGVGGCWWIACRRDENRKIEKVEKVEIFWKDSVQWKASNKNGGVPPAWQRD